MSDIGEVLGCVVGGGIWGKLHDESGMSGLRILGSPKNLGNLELGDVVGPLECEFAVYSLLDRRCWVLAERLVGILKHFSLRS